MVGTRMQGRCLCGSYRFEVEGPLAEVRLCHCDLCRRASGSAYSANCSVPIERYSVLSGTETIAEYESSPGAWRAFCSNCGSPAYARVESDPDHIRIRLGSLPRDAAATIAAHVWVGSKAAWEVIEDSLPCYERDADGPLMGRD